MRKKEFLETLEKELSSLPIHEREDAVKCCAQIFEELGDENEEKTAEKFGKPHNLALCIGESYAVNQMERKKANLKKYFFAAKIVMAGMFRATVSMPGKRFASVLLLILMMLVFLFMLEVVLFASACIGISLFVVCFGIIAVTTSLAGTLVIVGGGIIAAGVFTVLLFAVITAIKKIVRNLIKSIHRRNKRLIMEKINEMRRRTEERGENDNEEV